MIIDFHTHTFPDRIASQALDKLKSASHTCPFTDGTVTGLQASMQKAGIDISLVMPVATNFRQVEHVNDASILINREAGHTGIYSFGCMHPDFERPEEELTRLKSAGVMGIKLHPVYQGVDFDDARYLRILEACQKLELIVLIHAGDDIGFPGVQHASARMILNALRSTGPLKLVLAHMGGWRRWEEAASLLPGMGLYIDTSISMGCLTPGGDGYPWQEDELALMDDARALAVIRAFGADHTLFGSDSPWGGQAETLKALDRLELTEEEKKRILSSNALDLLGLKQEECPVRERN